MLTAGSLVEDQYSQQLTDQYHALLALLDITTNGGGDGGGGDGGGGDGGDGEGVQVCVAGDAVFCCCCMWCVLLVHVTRTLRVWVNVYIENHMGMVHHRAMNTPHDYGCPHIHDTHMYMKYQ